MKRVLIVGGTGLIGSYLSNKLRSKGYRVAVLSRTKKEEPESLTFIWDEYHFNYVWDVNKKEIEKNAIELADYIINLSGENIGEKRWTKKRKQLIVASRVKTTELIFEKVSEQENKPKAYISASAIGYYGAISSDKIFQETDSPAKDFLGETCRLWEQAADRFEKSGIRTVKIRTGVVLTKQDGALAKMLKPVKMGVGSALGNGKQYLPWIHIDDLCNIYIKALEDSEMHGAYNAVAPEHITNKVFTGTLARLLAKSLVFPNIPAFFMKIIFGKMSDLLLKGSRVSSEKIVDAGYNCLYPDLESALMDLLYKE